jgi:hypothetical protein
LADRPDMSCTPRRKYSDILTETAPVLVAPASVPVSSPRAPGRVSGTGVPACRRARCPSHGTLPRVYMNTSPYLCHTALVTAKLVLPPIQIWMYQSSPIIRVENVLNPSQGRLGRMSVNRVPRVTPGYAEQEYRSYRLGKVLGYVSGNVKPAFRLHHAAPRVRGLVLATVQNPAS